MILSSCKKPIVEAKRSFGVVLDSMDKISPVVVSENYRKKPHKPKGKPVDTTVIPTINLPTAYQIQMPAVGDQGNEGSCVSFSCVYYTASVEKKTLLSPEYVYDQVKSGDNCIDGSSVLGNLNFLYGYGTTSWNTLPYTDDGCTLVPTDTQKAEALTNRIASYRYVLGVDSVAIKSLLVSGHPLIFTFTVDANFYNAGVGYVWREYSNTTYAPHCITLCGYDDSKQAYRAINQWGVNWGDYGYIWIDYTLFTKIAYSVYTITI